MSALSTRKRPSCLLALAAALICTAVAAVLYASATRPYNDGRTTRTLETKREKYDSQQELAPHAKRQDLGFSLADIFRAPAGVGLSPGRSNAGELETFLAWQGQIQAHEFKRFSQNGEDGVIQYIFDNVGATDKFFVEFGTESGSEAGLMTVFP